MADSNSNNTSSPFDAILEGEFGDNLVNSSSEAFPSAAIVVEEVLADAAQTATIAASDPSNLPSPSSSSSVTSAGVGIEGYEEIAKVINEILDEICQPPLYQSPEKMEESNSSSVDPGSSDFTQDADEDDSDGGSSSDSDDSVVSSIPHTPRSTSAFTQTCTDYSQLSPGVSPIKKWPMPHSAAQIAEAAILIEENKLLAEKIRKQEAAMSFVMSKYRKSVTFLLDELNRYKDSCRELNMLIKRHGPNYDPAKLLLDKDLQILEMKQIMLAAAKTDDVVFQKYEEKLAQLAKENRELRNLLNIANNIGGNALLLKQTTDNSAQTVETADLEADKRDAYLEDFEDTASFHSARSFSGSGSSSSLASEEDGDPCPLSLVGAQISV